MNSSQVIFGLSYNEDLEDELYITVIATGFDTNQSSLDVGSDMPFGEVGYANPMQTDRSVRPSGNPFAQNSRQRSNMNSMRQTGFSSAPTRAQSKSSSRKLESRHNLYGRRADLSFSA